MLRHVEALTTVSLTLLLAWSVVAGGDLPSASVRRVQSVCPLKTYHDLTMTSNGLRFDLSTARRVAIYDMTRAVFRLFPGACRCFPPQRQVDVVAQPEASSHVLCDWSLDRRSQSSTSSRSATAMVGQDAVQVPRAVRVDGVEHAGANHVTDGVRLRTDGRYGATA